METLDVNDPLISIITPTYNHELYIRECIKSVIAQNYNNWEMIIVDDGSTDQTWEIIQQYVGEDNRIHAFRQENKGIWRLAETYNFALANSRGKLIAILEGDDMWPLTKLSIQVPAHESGGYNLSFGQIQSINASGVLLSKQVYPNVKRHSYLLKENSRGLFLRLLRGEFNIPAVTILLNKGALIEAGGFQQPHYLPVVDYPTCLILSSYGAGAGFINEILGFWRRYPNQSTRLYAPSMFSGVYRFAWEFAEQKELKLGIPSENIGQHLMGLERRRILCVDATFMDAALAFEKGDIRTAWLSIIEIGRSTIYHGFMLIKCIAMFGLKLARKIAKKFILNI